MTTGNFVKNERHLPELLSRDEMLDILFSQEYGTLPPPPTNLKWEIKEKLVKNFCAGKATLNQITMTCEMGEKAFSFPFYFTCPTAEGKHPFFIQISFRDEAPDAFVPTEELIDNGFAIFSFCHKNITSDDDDFTDGLAGVLYDNPVRQSTDPGKIALWAWAAHRVMDYAQTLEDILDLQNAVVCGHSRLGKTALLTAATDERFAFAYSNNSGCSGAAITRNKVGETVKDICNRFPYWFCENYKQYINNEESMPFDQHYLVACIAPRRVLIGSADEDLWADPFSEQLCCVAAAPAFPNGFACDKLPAEVGDEFLTGDIGYHLRQGPHYYSRTDWLKLIKFVNIHLNT